MKKALICGISGQDGSYLAQFLLKKRYEIYGTSRDAQVSPFHKLIRLGIREQVKLESMAINDFRSVFQTIIKTDPDEIYNLAGQTSVGLSFQQPVETLESISVGTLNLLESIRFIKKPIKFYNACSSECFGDTDGIPANENTPFRPRSPYAVAKAAAFWEVANYRDAYGLFACSGILFNHESPMRPDRFVTKKIISESCKIANKSKKEIRLGNISIQRDWGWAPEYVEAMWLMLQQDEPDDYVIATGETRSLKEFIDIAFSYLNLRWQDYVKTDSELFRPADLMTGNANPSKAYEKLGWKAKYKMQDIVRMMIESELKNYSEK